MRIKSLHIENFRAVRNLDLVDLSNAIVIAGANGCGKSNVFDAIKLLKSAYGQYSPNELQRWFNEAQIDIQRLAEEASRVLHDPAQPLRIRAQIEFATEEISFLKKHGPEIVGQIRAPLPAGNRNSPQPFAAGNSISKTNHSSVTLKKELRKKTFTAELTMSPDGKVSVARSPVLEIAFSIFPSQRLGMIDYHGPYRNYVREQIGGINLKIEDASQKYSQHALYDTQNKYNTVKTEMAASYVRQLLSQEAGLKLAHEDSLIDTLQELFEIFFPGKEFRGIIPTVDGGISFPVRLQSGREHDINELSSGEKEVLLGYLRLRNSAPKHSIILLDEPELHLNPRLIRGLPRFYQKHVGAALNNQLWLITHSDALLREAVDEPTYSVFHMEPAHIAPSGTNQLHPISATAEVERALIDLVGDLASYSPRSKVVLLEGSGSEFDASLLQRLFPDFAERANLISVGSKRHVMQMHDLLNEASRKGKIAERFFSIVDRDFDGPEPEAAVSRFHWNVYHIENYLLEPKFIRDVVVSLQTKPVQLTEREVEHQLKECARKTIDDLVRIKMDRFVNSTLVSCVNTKFDPALPIAEGFRLAAEKSNEKLGGILEKRLTNKQLVQLENKTRSSLTRAIADGRWKSEFRGRDILQRFSHSQGGQIGYERFRNLVLSRMAEAGFQPDGMKKVVKAITDDNGGTPTRVAHFKQKK